MPEDPQEDKKRRKKDKDEKGGKKKKQKTKHRPQDHAPAPFEEPEVTNGAEAAPATEDQAEPANGRSFTVSVAIPGSIIQNAQTVQLATTMAGQIARAMAIFRVDEVVIFDDGEPPKASKSGPRDDSTHSSDGTGFLARLLQYLETPQYLRRALVGKHPDLRFAGLLPPLDAPHHARAHEWIPYREGAVVPDPAGGATSSLVNVGLTKNIRIKHSLPPNTRLTIAMGPEEVDLEGTVFDVVVPEEPTAKSGVYWGYTVRVAKHLSGVFADCPYEGGYDFSIGTSERGDTPATSLQMKIPPFKHLLIAFGGLGGLEEAVERDPNLEVKGARFMFDSYLNTCRTQGSRTIRCEEAVLVSLTFLQPVLDGAE